VLSITKEINNRDGGSGFDTEKSKANKLSGNVRVHIEMRSKRELWVKPSLNSMKVEEEEMLAKG
jgi:hypothetical protein